MTRKYKIKYNGKCKKINMIINLKKNYDNKIYYQI
jgi:hypothetical protein